MDTKPTGTVVVTGGGTGGHLFPALAVIESLQLKAPEIPLAYIGTEKDRLEAERRKIPVWSLKLAGLQRKFSFHNIQSLWLTLIGITRCVILMRRWKKGVVFGVGGYVSAPAMIAGKILGWRLMMHEQNTVPGVVNRVLAKGCSTVFITYPVTAAYLKKANCRVSGFPLRRELLEAQKMVAKKEETGEISILVIGGSQGARKVTETAIAAFRLMESENCAFHVTLQTGAKNLDWAVSLNPPANVELVPFINTMAVAYANADIVISRSGSGSLSEIAMWGLPSILIPYPFASEEHQKYNAKAFADEKAAVMIEEKDLTPDKLKTELLEMILNKANRVEMSRRVLALAKIDAAEVIANEILSGFGREFPSQDREGLGAG